MSKIEQRVHRFHIRKNNLIKKAISRVKSFSCYQESSLDKTCTTARNFIRSNKIKPPCIIIVIKKSGQYNKLFLSKAGLFDYKYAVINYKVLSL
jgi:hypothetical protein